MNKQQKFEFKYQGENFIDLNTLITSQFHFLAAVNELQKELYPDVDVKIKVGAFNQGSFVVDLLMESNWKDQLFNKDNLFVLNAIVGSFASIVAIHGYLKGRKASKIEEEGDDITIKVEGESNNIKVDKLVFEIYKNNTTINRSMQQNFELLNADSEIEGVSISTEAKTGKKDMLHVERGQFEDLSMHNPYFDKVTMDETHLKQNLFIKKPNLFPEKNRVWKWDMLHKGRDISVKITDKAFAERMNKGLRVGQGDRLVADLKIEYKYSESFATYIENGRYEIVKVYDVIPRNEQSSMNL